MSFFEILKLAYAIYREVPSVLKLINEIMDVIKKSRATHTNVHYAELLHILSLWIVHHDPAVLEKALEAFKIKLSSRFPT